MGNRICRRHWSTFGVSPDVVLVVVPMLVYLASLWVVRPVPLSLVVPGVFVVLPLVVMISRRTLCAGLVRARVELVLVAAMLVLSLLSIANSDEPVRSARIIFPCLLPMLLLPACVAWLGRVRRPHLWVTRGLVAGAAVFCLLPFMAMLVVPALRAWLFDTYRYQAFFENPIQCAIALAVTVPLIVGELVLAKRGRATLGWALLLLAAAYVMFRTGSKFPMLVGLVSGLGVALVLQLHRLSAGRVATTLFVLVVGGLFLWRFGFGIADRIDPQIGERLRQIFEGGVSSYHSIQSRQLLWGEAIEEGRAHWLIGSGAGETVRGLSHAHNLVLDYFKGIGFFGAAAVVLLCLAILARLLKKTWFLLRARGDEDDHRLWVCYLAASGYVVCNQLSDSFGPSTIGFLWVLYVMAMVSDRPSLADLPARRPAPAPARPLRARLSC